MEAGIRHLESSLENRNTSIETKVVAFALGIAEVELWMGPKVSVPIMIDSSQEEQLGWRQKKILKEQFWMRTSNIWISIKFYWHLPVWKLLQNHHQSLKSLLWCPKVPLEFPRPWKQMWSEQAASPEREISNRGQIVWPAAVPKALRPWKLQLRGAPHNLDVKEPSRVLEVCKSKPWSPKLRHHPRLAELI